MDYIKLFDQHSEYETYINSENKKLPNLSYCEDEDDVHFNPIPDPRIIATFNVTNIEQPIYILCTDTNGFNDIKTKISEIEIDGVIQSEIPQTYQFNRIGRHIIKYRLNENLNEFPYYIGTYVNYGMFYYCQNLINIIIPNQIKGFGYGTFSYCNALNNVIIPNNFTTIADSTFIGCRSLTSITIHDNITSIGNYAFENCDSLTSVIIPDSVTSIGTYAFSECDNLTTIIIGNGIKTLPGGYTFYNSIKLNNITIHAITPPTLGGPSIFSLISGDFKVYVPEESVDTYKTTPSPSTVYYGWKDFASRIYPIT